MSDYEHDDQQQSGNRMQNGMRDGRTHVPRQKSRHGIEPPRTILEQLDELATEIDDQRRRDPVRAAELQHTERDSGVGGAWVDRPRRVSRYEDEVCFEKLPDRHEQRFDDGE